MGKNIDNFLNKKCNYKNKKINHYDFAKLGYYKPDAINQLENIPETYLIHDYIRYNYQYCKS